MANSTPFDPILFKSPEWSCVACLAWIVKNRRFVRDYEQLTAVAETLITIAAAITLIRRWP